MTEHTNLCEKDRKADNKDLQTCEGDTNNIRVIPQRSAFQEQKN